MVQVSMGMNTPVYYEEVTVAENAPGLRVINKKIPNQNGEFEDRKFIRIPRQMVSEQFTGKSKLEEWCYETYGKPQYLKAWFKTHSDIVLDEKVYTHWKLCE